MADKTTDRTPFAEKLIELRKAKGLNQRQAAEAIGIDYRNYRKYETISLPKAEVYIRIADYFDVSIDYLMGRTEKKSVKRKKVTTYSERENDTSFVIHQKNAKYKVVENNLGELSPLEIMVIQKLRKISTEDKNDVAQYLNNKKDI